MGVRAMSLGAVLSALVAANVLAAPPVGAGATLVSVVSPQPGSLQTSETVEVRVRTRGPLAGFRALLRGPRGQRDVSSRFGPAERGERIGVLRLGRELVPGANQIIVPVTTRSGKRHYAGVRVTVARPATGLLRLSGVSGGGLRAPLRVRVAGPRGARLVASLNGRSVRGAFERRGGSWVGRLDADHGLRFERNLLTVTVATAAGRYQRVRRGFDIARTRPLPGAGAGRLVRSGSPVRLDGRASRSGLTDGMPAMSWRIVSRPPRSKTRLQGATSARPRLAPDRPGRYIIALRAVDPGAARGQRALQAGPAGAASSDTVTVTAQPDVLPTGVPVATTPSGAGAGIEMGGTPYPTGSAWAQMLVLDRATTAVPSGAGTTYPGTDAGAAQLLADVTALSPASLVIITGDSSTAQLSSAGAQSATAAFAAVGGTFSPQGSRQQLLSGPWSVVGVPGLGAGLAYQLVGLSMGQGAAPGAMTGFLRLDSSTNYTFTWPATFQTFDTQAPGATATQSQIAVGSQTYVSDPLAVGEAGFHLLALSADSLAVLDELTFSTSSGPDFAAFMDGGNLTPISQSVPPPLILLTSIGQPRVDPSASGTGGEWSALAGWLQQFGANQYVVIGLDGTGGYSLVGLQGIDQQGPNSGTELSQSLMDAPSARLAGVLARNRQGLYAAGANGSPAAGAAATPYQPQVQQLLAQPNRAFPAFDAPGQATAEQQIAKALSLPYDAIYGIRGNYWGNTSLDWGVLRSGLEGLTAAAVCTDPACTAAFSGVQTRLFTEFGAVANVYNYFTGGGLGTVSGLLGNTFADSGVGFAATAFDIVSYYNPPAVPAQGDNPTAILDDTLTIASGAAGPIPEAGAVVSGGATLIVGINQLIADTTNSSDGTPGIDPTGFEADVGAFGQGLEDAWTDALDDLSSVAELLVSDAGRLAAANAAINTPGSQGGWGLDTQVTRPQVQQATARTIGAYIWSSLLPVPMTVWPCGVYPRPLYPFNYTIPQDTTAEVALGGGAATRPVFTEYIFLADRKGDSLEPLTFPRAADLAKLFGNPLDDPDSYGLERQYFMAPAILGPKFTALSPGFRYQSIDDTIGVTLNFECRA